MHKFRRYLFFCALVLILLSGCGSSAPPEIDGITIARVRVSPGEELTLSARATGKAPLTYQWTASAGTFGDPHTNPTTYTAPPTPGEYQIIVEVSDKNDMTSTHDVTIAVLEEPTAIPTPTFTASPTATPPPTATPTPTPTATATPTATPTPTPTPTPVPPLVILLEDFEAARQMTWWSPDTDTFQYSETSDHAYRGSFSLQVDYSKTDSYQYIAAEIPTRLRNLYATNELWVWVYGEVTLLVKLQDEELREAEICTVSAANPDGWTALSCDYSGAENVIDLGHVKNVFLFPAPGDPGTQGTFYIDHLILRE